MGGYIDFAMCYSDSNRIWEVNKMNEEEEKKLDKLDLMISRLEGMILKLATPKEPIARITAGEPATEKQINWMKWKNIEIPEGVSKVEASQIIEEYIIKEKEGEKGVKTDGEAKI